MAVILVILKESKMIIIFGKKGHSKTNTEKHLLEAEGRRLTFYDIDSKVGKEELRKRGLFYKDVVSNIPLVIDEVNG